MCRSVGTLPGTLGLVWASFRPQSGPKSKISGRILKRFPGPLSSAAMSQKYVSAKAVGGINLQNNRWVVGGGGPVDVPYWRLYVS